MDYKIFDESGEWVVNRCLFPMSDGQRQLRFDPNIPCKVVVAGWVANQVKAGVLTKIDDPMAKKAAPAVKAESEPEPVVETVEAPVKPKSRSRKGS